MGKKKGWGNKVKGTMHRKSTASKNSPTANLAASPPADAADEEEGEDAAAQSDVEVSEPAAAVDVPPGGCRCSARAGPPPPIIACAFGALVPLMKPTWGPQRAQAPSRRWRCGVVVNDDNCDGDMPLAS